MADEVIEEKNSDDPARAPKRRSVGALAGNLGEPIRFSGFAFAGIAAEAGRPGQQIGVYDRLSLTSDDPLFHRAIEGIASVLERHAREAGSSVSLARAGRVLLVARPTGSAELWVDTAAETLQIVARREVVAGRAVFERDIADVIGLSFPLAEIGPADRVLYLFREGWRFGLFFDVSADGIPSAEGLARELARLYRNMKFRHLYDLQGDIALFETLAVAGWFPFVEIIGDEFKRLMRAAEAGFALGDEEQALLRAFDGPRVDHMLARWLAKPHFSAKEAILRTAVEAFKRGEPVAVLKTCLTEIEGILSDACFRKTGQRAKLAKLVEFAVASAAHKSGAPDTLMFPEAFARYLGHSALARFDPVAATGTASSRHAVGHGAAPADTYTMTRALQSLLTLDQLAFYT
jgi:hypothetical protein